MLFGSPFTRRISFLAIGLVLLWYLAFSIDTRLLRVRINQLPIEVERRILWDSWPDTDEEIFCRAPHDLEAKNPIPSVAHFIMLAPEGKKVELSFAKYLAIKSAIMRMKVSMIKIHTRDGRMADSEYWDMLKNYVVIETLDAYKDVGGPHEFSMKKLGLAHQADVLRLAILQREGGIYLDTDVYVLKSFTDLRSSPRDTVMGHEGGNRYGLCNAVIVSRPNSSFITIWQEQYRRFFDPDQWNVYSVLEPKRLQIQYPELICPLSPKVFFWPTWAKKHVSYMYDPITNAEATQLKTAMNTNGGAMYENQLSFHAWGGHDQLNNLTMKRVETENTRFNLLLREIALAPL